jgi:hypothetical protein
VTTSWGWYGSQAGPGVSSESVSLKDIPHCTVLQVYGDNLYATSQQAPSLKVAVTPNAAITPTPQAEPDAAPEPDPEPAATPNETPATGAPGWLLVTAMGALGASALGRPSRRR